MPSSLLTSWFWFTFLGCPASHRYPDGGGLEGQLNREIIAAKEHIKMLEADLVACGEGNAPNTLFPELKQVFQGSDVEVERTGASTQLIVRTSHLFGDAYALKFRAEADPTIDLLATALQLHPEYQVMVIGHTSDRPLPRTARVYSSHTDWSARLAGSLVQRLVTDFACAPERFTVAGRGQYAPSESNDLETGRDANQRLEIWIYPPSVAPPSPE